MINPVILTGFCLVMFGFLAGILVGYFVTRTLQPMQILITNADKVINGDPMKGVKPTQPGVTVLTPEKEATFAKLQHEKDTRW